VIKFVSDLWQVCSFLWVLRFPPPIKLSHDITEILLKVALDTIALTLHGIQTFDSVRRLAIVLLIPERGISTNSSSSPGITIGWGWATGLFCTSFWLTEGLGVTACKSCFFKLFDFMNLSISLKRKRNQFYLYEKYMNICINHFILLINYTKIKTKYLFLSWKNLTHKKYWKPNMKPV